ncbi:Oxidoreductase [Pseudomonas cichorii]|uniref:Oxidoreductase n=1 Tax=Pseudomonas cichorii TaxID=36746 RepID=A0A3M4M900_PSECI|nr:nitroreductase family protein [Pseudomonas cichorii]RMQ50270.1 Oxidoreductase [Pseudomonas cichorii]
MTTHADSRTALLEQRYGAQTKPDNIHWNPQVEAMLNHRSVRAFLPEPLAQGTLETMVAAAQSASSGSGLHQWSLIAVTDPELKQKLSDTIARTVPTDRIPWIEEAPALLLWVADVSRSAQITRTQGDEPLVFDYLDSFLMASIDVSLAAQNASLAAESMGLGAVFLGVMRNAAREVAELVNLPPHSFIPFGMAVGHPDPTRPSGIRPRPAQPVVLHYNRYNHEGYRDYLEGYEQAFLQFRQDRGMQIKTWQQAVHSSTTSMAYMGGREHLREMVVQQGFKLR